MRRWLGACCGTSVFASFAQEDASQGFGAYLSQRSVTGTVTTGASYINDAAGRAIAAFVSVPGVPEQLVWIVSNARGDVLELLDGDGNALSYRHYAPYGELTNTDSRAAGSLSATQTAAIRDTVKLRYAGYVYDDESGLYYCSARYYDPITCQFISKDPARADGEESAYQYCGGGPWIPGYKVYSWIMRQAIYTVLAGRLAGAAGKAIRASFGTRYIGVPSARFGRRLVSRSLGVLSSIPSRVDSAMAHATDFKAKNLDGWRVWRPSVMLWLYRETARRTTYLDVSVWKTRRAFSARSGYRRVWSWRPRAWTDSGFLEAAKSYGYVRRAK